MPSKQILVVTDHEDAHLPFVQRHLAEQMVLVDPINIATKQTLSFSFAKGGPRITLGGKKLKPTSVWYRKPMPVKADVLQIEQSYHGYALDALYKHTNALYAAFPDAFWVSDYYAIYRASDKPLQISLASTLGFRVPETIFTSDATEAEAFITKHGNCIMKTVAPFITEVGKDRQKTLYATKISSKAMPDLRGLHQSPLIFQEAIDASYDVRVSVVGNQVFAARIVYRGDNNSTVRDWRLGHYEGRLTIVPDDKFPKDVEQKCIEHARRLGLNFSAIDLVVDKKGVYWFLENNPNGQWAFVEKETDQPIGKALAEMLLSGMRI